MEQNLSERERKIRLSMGIIAGIASGTLYWFNGISILVLVLAGLAIGFGINYFTCFCGTKKAICAFKEKLGN